MTNVVKVVGNLFTDKDSISKTVFIVNLTTELFKQSKQDLESVLEQDKPEFIKDFARKELARVIEAHTEYKDLLEQLIDIHDFKPTEMHSTTNRTTIKFPILKLNLNKIPTRIAEAWSKLTLDGYKLTFSLNDNIRAISKEQKRLETLHNRYVDYNNLSL